MASREQDIRNEARNIPSSRLRTEIQTAAKNKVGLFVAALILAGVSVLPILDLLTQKTDGGKLGDTIELGAVVGFAYVFDKKSKGEEKRSVVYKEELERRPKEFQ